MGNPSKCPYQYSRYLTSDVVGVCAQCQWVDGSGYVLGRIYLGSTGLPTLSSVVTAADMWYDVIFWLDLRKLCLQLFNSWSSP